MANEMRPTISDEELLMCIERFDTSLEALKDSRDSAMIDREFYDGYQWTDEQIAELESRGQAVITTNHIAPKINYCLGEQIGARVDPAAWPINPFHEEGADALTKAMRSVMDANDADIYQSEAFEEFMIEGTGAILVTQERIGGRVRIKLTPVPWDRFAWDHRSRRRDFADARWLAIVAWYDLPDAKDEYPGNDEMLEEAVMHGYDAHDDIFDDWPEYWAERNSKRVRICQMFYQKKGDWYEAHFTKCENGWLRKPEKVTLIDDDGKTQCPLIAASPYVARKRSHKSPDRRGVVRGLISPQKEINKQRSKAHHLVAMNQVISEDGAFVMSREEVLEQLARPDGFVVAANGALKDRIMIRTNLEWAQSQFAMMQEIKGEINNIGPQAPMIASDERVQTGRSLEKRQEAGEKQLKPVFDSLRFFLRRLYRAVSWKIKRYWTAEDWLRVTDDREQRGYRFVAINRPVQRSVRLRELLSENVPLNQALLCLGFDSPIVGEDLLQFATSRANQQMQEMQATLGQNMQPEAMMPIMQQATIQALLEMPIMQETFTQNPIGDIPTDIKIDVTPESSVLQHEQFEKLVELAGTGQVQIPSSVLIRASSLREKKELLAELNPPPDPMAQQMAMLNLALLQAKVEETKAKAEELRAKAADLGGNVQFKAGPQAAKTMAQAMEAAASAGEKTVPDDERQP
jgi:hypothetical protein